MTPILALLLLPLQQTASDTPDLAELERRIEALSDELEALRLGPDLLGGELVSRYGFAPGASKIYSVPDGVSIGGYGELLFTDRQGGPNEADFLRAVLYAGYKFDDHWLVNSEYEFEHATVSDTNDGSGDESPGSVSVEFAYIEYRHTEQFGARGGLVLIPMGLANELHEPINFPSVNRPELERQILPSTWRENGVGVFGETDDWSWRAYLVNGFDAAGFSASGLRGGRQKGGKAKADDLAVVARVDYVGHEGLLAGASVYHGGAGQDNAGFGETPVTLVDAHVDWRHAGLRLRSVGVLGFIDDVEELNTAQGLLGTDSVGEELNGYYVELGYDVAPLFGGAVSGELSPFVRWSEFDTQADVPAGFASDPANDRELLTLGVAWLPIPNITLKLDFVDADNGAGTGEDLVRLAAGYVF